MKAFFRKANDVILVAIAALGVPLAFYGAYFQTENFKWVPALHCLYTVIVAVTVAYFMMNYFEEQVVSGKPGAITSRKGTKAILQGSWLSFLCGLLVLYRCTTRLAFHIGLFVMLFAWACIVFHFILSKHYRKKAEEKKE